MEEKEAISKNKRVFFFLSLVSLSLVAIITLIAFIQVYLVIPDNSVVLFTILIVIVSLIFLLFVKNLKKLEIKGEFNKFEPSRTQKIINGIFETLENFPNVNEYSRKKRIIISYFGWFLLGFLFFIGVMIRNCIEFQTINFTLDGWIMGYTFYIFVFSLGCLSIKLFSDMNINKIIKMIAIGFVIVIQVPYLIDYYMLNQPRAHGYNFVEWSDFGRLFTSFFLSPNLSYAIGLGHFVMSVFLIGLSGFYVFFRSHYDFKLKIKKNLKISLSRTLLVICSMYIIISFSLISFPYFRSFIELMIQNLPPSPNLPFLLIGTGYNIYFFAFIFLLVLKIYEDERTIKNLKLETHQKMKQNDNKMNTSSEVMGNFDAHIIVKFLIILIVILCFEITTLFAIYMM